jgi:hypothetical protein
MVAVIATEASPIYKFNKIDGYISSIYSTHTVLLWIEQTEKISLPAKSQWYTVLNNLPSHISKTDLN